MWSGLKWISSVSDVLFLLKRPSNGRKENKKQQKKVSAFLGQNAACVLKNVALNYDSRNSVHGSIDHLEFQQVQSRSEISLCIFTLQLWRCLSPMVWVRGPTHIHHISCRPCWFARCLCSLKWGGLCFVTQITSLSSSDVFPPNFLRSRNNRLQDISKRHYFFSLDKQVDVERDPGNPCLGSGGCQPLWRLLSAAPALEAVQLWQQGFSFTFLIKAVQYQRRWEFWPTFSLHFSCIFFTKALAAPNRIRLLFF